MCTALFGSSPKIESPPPPPPPPEETEPMEFVEEDDTKKKKALGTKRLQIDLGGSTGKAGLNVPKG